MTTVSTEALYTEIGRLRKELLLRHLDLVQCALNARIARETRDAYIQHLLAKPSQPCNLRTLLNTIFNKFTRTKV